MGLIPHHVIHKEHVQPDAEHRADQRERDRFSRRHDGDEPEHRHNYLIHEKLRGLVFNVRKHRHMIHLISYLSYFNPCSAFFQDHIYKIYI